ncbi:MAG: MotA/TolQ/ExbB proton channel family protein [Myxococcota bacterium]
MHQVPALHLVSLQAATSAAGAAESLDPMQLMLDASPVVKLVLLVLTVMFLGCLFIVGMKSVRLAQARATSRRFLDLFWGGEDGSPWSADRLEGLYAQLRAYKRSPLAVLFRAGYVELARMDDPSNADADLHNVERALKRATASEMTELETLLPVLATTGSTAPFIGLFGTVWGIMQSFIAIHGQKNATLDVVAPGIAEALIATALGLAAAIPAVMAYNYFVRRLRVLEAEMEAFANDYLNIVRRHFLRG